MSQFHFPLRYHSIFLSDVHLGYYGCKAEYLLSFLRATESKYLYLVGDIVDFWSMKKNFFWPKAHNEILHLLMEKAKNGTNVIFVPGNHDEDLRQFCGMEFENLKVQKQAEHTTVNNKKFLIIHGDQFDSQIQCGKLKKFIGNYLYDAIIFMNNWLHRIRNRMGFGFWSLSVFIKTRVKDALEHIRYFEEAATSEAGDHGYDGVVCGHIHHPSLKKVDDILYINTGDWVENCTALVEQFDGTLELLHWSQKKDTLSLHRGESDQQAQEINPEKVA